MLLLAFAPMLPDLMHAPGAPLFSGPYLGPQPTARNGEKPGAPLQSHGGYPKAHAQNVPKADSIQNAFAKGHFSLDARYRLHVVEEASKPFDATASTLRLRAGFRTAEFEGVSGYLELDHTEALGASKYNHALDPRPGYPTIPDPKVTEMQQAYLEVRELGGFEVRFGRMTPSLDDRRYLAPGSFRQNARSLDGLRVTNTGLKNLTLKYYYHWNFNLPLGDDHPAGDWNTDAHLLFAEYAGFKNARISSFGYLLKVKDDAPQSSQTFGMRLHGKAKLGAGAHALYEAQYAYQRDYANNPNNYAGVIFWASAGLQSGRFTAKIGYENLEGDGTNAVRFATGARHRYQGLADQFRAIPPEGLIDTYAHLTYRMPDMGFMKKPILHLEYHDFEAQNTLDAYGTEWDVRYSFTANRRLRFMLLYAGYRSQGFKSDLSSYVMQLTFNF